MSKPNLILEGIKVVEVSTYVFGPATATILSDFGAEVIKIEPPGIGDPHRFLHTIRPNPESEIPYMFLLEGRNKKSIVANLKHEEGRKIALDLIRGADVFVTNFHPSVLNDLGLTYDKLREVNERLIYAQASGYGENGPDVEQPGYDMTAWWARSGLMDLVRSEENVPALSVAGMGDHPSAVSLFSAVMLALYNRERTGVGTKVSTSLVANGAWSNGCLIQGALAGAGAYGYPSRESSPNPLVNHYTTRDGKRFIICGIRADKDWVAVCKSTGRDDLLENERYATMEGRIQHSPEIIATLDAEFIKKDLTEWRALFKEHELTCSPVWEFREVADDPAMTENGIFVDMDHPKYGPMKTVNSPMAVLGADKVAPQPAPELGQHTETVLESLGYSEADIERLKTEGIVASYEGEKE